MQKQAKATLLGFQGVAQARRRFLEESQVLTLLTVQSNTCFVRTLNHRPAVGWNRCPPETQPSHRNCMKTTENMAFSLPLWAMGRGVGVKLRLDAIKPNGINGFVHKSYGTTVLQRQLRKRRFSFQPD